MSLCIRLTAVVKLQDFERLLRRERRGRTNYESRQTTRFKTYTEIRLLNRKFCEDTDKQEFYKFSMCRTI